MFTKFQWWNPLSWIGTILQSIGVFLHMLGISFGLIQPPRSDGHENIQTTDVTDAEEDARREQEAIDEIVAYMTPAQVVHAYCKASVEARKTINLAPLSMEQQDWLMRLSDKDLVLLRGSGETACGRSVEAMRVIVNRSKLRPAQMEAAPQVLKIPGADPIADEMTDDEKREYHREFFANRHAELFLASGAPNLIPTFTPRGATVH